MGSTRAAKFSTVDSLFTNLFTNCGDYAGRWRLPLLVGEP